MIQDVIDLRQSKWIPRRQDLNPKTMDQIQKEAENEHLAIQVIKIFMLHYLNLLLLKICNSKLNSNS